MMKRSIFKLTAILVLYFLAFSHLPVLAGEGDGSGGGQGQPLALESSYPGSGMTGVSPQVQIKLTFNKNVVNMSVRDNNRQCFALSSDGQTIPIDIIMADDQVYPEGKNDVSLKPRQALAPGTRYTVTVAPSLQSKSGAVLGKTITISFTTIGTPAAAVTPSTPPQQGAGSVQGSSAAYPAPEPIAAPSSNAAGLTVTENREALPATQVQPVENAQQAKPEPQQTAASPVQESQPQQGPDYGFWMIIKGGLVLAVILAYVLVRYRRK